jgi:hypothetical protein
MNVLEMTMTVDVSVLQRLIPQIVAYGRRTLREQCITSAYFICHEAQKNTRAAEIGAIDEALQVEVTNRTSTGRLSTAKRPHHKRVDLAAGVPVPLAVLIVMARTDPESGYSKLTGNRWPLDLGLLPTGKGSGPARAEQIREWVERMTLSRHSSTHFLQHGWLPAIKTLLSDPDYYAGARLRGVKQQQDQINPLNSLDHMDLGQALISALGDEVRVVAENAVGSSTGEDGNEVLSKKHRVALIFYGRQACQLAIREEEINLRSKMQEWFDRGLKQTFVDV